MAEFPHLSLSVIFPAYNEVGNIERTIPQAVATLRKMVGAFEVIVIDDCSRDATHAVALELARDVPELTVLRNEQNLRQGGTLARGFALATKDLVTHNAMDYPFDFEDLPPLLSRFPHADVVVASRKAYPGTTAPRRFISYCNRALLRTVFGTTTRDYNFIQIYKRTVLATMPTLSTATSFITAEKIIRAHHAGNIVEEVEVDYHRREIGTPSSANLKNIRRALTDIARLRWELGPK